MGMMRRHNSLSTSVSLPLDLHERLDRVSHELRVPKSAIIQEALVKELPGWEKRLEHVKVDGEATGAAARSTPVATRP